MLYTRLQVKWWFCYNFVCIICCVKGDQQIVWYIIIFNAKMAMKKKKKRSLKWAKKGLKWAQTRQKKKKKRLVRCG